METRQGDGTEALSQETESNGSATPKSRRHPLTLPPDWWGFFPLKELILCLSIYRIISFISSRPPAGNAIR